MRRSRLSARLVLLGRLTLGAMLIGGSSCASSRSLVAHDGSKIRRPLTLHGAMRALDRFLSPEQIEQLRRGEAGPAGMHFGVGLSIRNYWGLWHRSPLALWFRVRGVWHADDMSSIILTSYVRRLRGEPIELREQIADSKAYWEAAAAERQAEIASGPTRAAKVEADRMGWTYAPRAVPVLPFPSADDAPFMLDHAPFDRRPWRLEPYRGGALVLVKPRDAAQPEISWLAPDTLFVHPVQRTDCSELHDVLTLGTTTHWLCRDAEGWTVVHEPAEGEGEAQRERIEVDGDGPRLGSAGNELLVLDPRRLYRRNARAQRWEVVHEREGEWLAPDATPPRLMGDHLYFIAGDHRTEEPDVLRWDLTDPSAGPESGWRLLLVPYYGRWSNSCYSIAPSAVGGLWITGGHRFFATLFHVDRGATKLAVFEGSVDRPTRYHEGFLEHPALDTAALHRQIPATTVAEVGDTLYLAGDLGLARSHAGRIEPIVRFAVDPRDLENAATDPSRGPHALVVLSIPDEPPSFVVATSRLAVVRAKGSGYAMAWPKPGDAIVLGPT